MTPRERLEAAGMCSDCESNQCAASCRCPCHQKNANQAARLARDEAKETSDGSVKEKVQLETVSVPYVSSPVAGNVATQGYAQNSVQSAPVVSEMLGKYLNTMVADLHIEGKGQYLRDLFSKFEREYASSSSAAPERKPWLESINAELAQLREWANTESKRAEAAEAKCAELQQHVDEWKRITANRDNSMVEQRGELSKAKTERDALRDSRDRLQGQVAELRGQLEVRETLAAADLEKLKELEDNPAQDEREIEALQESLRTVRQDLADRDGIIIGLQDVAAGKTRPLTDIEAELRGNKS